MSILSNDKIIELEINDFYNGDSLSVINCNSLENLIIDNKSIKILKIDCRCNVILVNVPELNELILLNVKSVVFGNHKNLLDLTINNVNLGKMVINENYSRLQTLKLTNCKINELKISIDLLDLRCLVINKCGLKNLILDNKVCNIVTLMILDNDMEVFISNHPFEKIKNLYLYGNKLIKPLFKVCDIIDTLYIDIETSYPKSLYEALKLSNIDIYTKGYKILNYNKIKFHEE